MVHCISLYRIVEDETYMCFFQVAAEKFANFWSFRYDLRRMLETPINTHDHFCNQTLISTETNKGAVALFLEYGFKVSYICLQRLFDFPESICFVIVLSLWTMAYQFEKKINETATVKEVLNTNFDNNLSGLINHG